MQLWRKKAKTGSGLLPAPKPVLLGRAVSLLAARRGLEVLAYLLVYAVLYFFLGQLLVMDARWLRTLLNLAALGGLYYLMFHEGIGTGEGDAAFAEIAMSRCGQASRRPRRSGPMLSSAGFYGFRRRSAPAALSSSTPRRRFGSTSAWARASAERYELRADICWRCPTITNPPPDHQGSPTSGGPAGGLSLRQPAGWGRTLCWR